MLSGGGGGGGGGGGEGGGEGGEGGGELEGVDPRRGNLAVEAEFRRSDVFLISMPPFMGFAAYEEKDDADADDAADDEGFCCCCSCSTCRSCCFCFCSFDSGGVFELLLSAALLPSLKHPLLRE